MPSEVKCGSASIQCLFRPLQSAGGGTSQNNNAMQCMHAIECNVTKAEATVEVRKDDVSMAES
jgi:hypothetical protein